MPGPIHPMDVSTEFGDAELFESAFLPLPVDGRDSLGDLWHDVTWPHLYVQEKYDTIHFKQLSTSRYPCHQG